MLSVPTPLDIVPNAVVSTSQIKGYHPWMEKGHTGDNSAVSGVQNPH